MSSFLLKVQSFSEGINQLALVSYDSGPQHL